MTNRAPIDVAIDRRNCHVLISTAAGPGRLAILDANGNIIDNETVVDRVREALIEALFDEFAPHLKKHSRVLPPPQPR